MVANASQELAEKDQMTPNIRSFFGCQMSYKKSPVLSLLLHLFVYRISKLCKVFTQYTSDEVPYIAKSSTQK
jgi:hypothetical protein